MKHLRDYPPSLWERIFPKEGYFSTTWLLEHAHCNSIAIDKQLSKTAGASKVNFTRIRRKRPATLDGNAQRKTHALLEECKVIYPYVSLGEECHNIQKYTSPDEMQHLLFIYGSPKAREKTVSSMRDMLFLKESAFPEVTQFLRVCATETLPYYDLVVLDYICGLLKMIYSAANAQCPVIMMDELSFTSNSDNVRSRICDIQTGRLTKGIVFRDYTFINKVSTGNLRGLCQALFNALQKHSLQTNPDMKLLLDETRSIIKSTLDVNTDVRTHGYLPPSPMDEAIHNIEHGVSTYV